MAATSTTQYLFFDLLGLKDKSPTEVQKTFRKVMLVLHPDKLHGTDADVTAKLDEQLKEFPLLLECIKTIKSHKGITFINAIKELVPHINSFKTTIDDDDAQLEKLGIQISPLGKIKFFKLLTPGELFQFFINYCQLAQLIKNRKATEADQSKWQQLHRQLTENIDSISDWPRDDITRFFVAIAEYLRKNPRNICLKTLPAVVSILIGTATKFKINRENAYRHAYASHYHTYCFAPLGIVYFNKAMQLQRLNNFAITDRPYTEKKHQQICSLADLLIKNPRLDKTGNIAIELMTILSIQSEFTPESDRSKELHSQLYKHAFDRQNPMAYYLYAEDTFEKWFGEGRRAEGVSTITMRKLITDIETTINLIQSPRFGKIPSDVIKYYAEEDDIIPPERMLVIKLNEFKAQIAGTIIGIESRSDEPTIARLEATLDAERRKCRVRETELAAVQAQLELAQTQLASLPPAQRAVSPAEAVIRTGMPGIRSAASFFAAAALHPHPHRPAQSPTSAEHGR